MTDCLDTTKFPFRTVSVNGPCPPGMLPETSGINQGPGIVPGQGLLPGGEVPATPFTPSTDITGQSGKPLDWSSLQKAFNWFSGTSGADHWKGIGLLVAATVLGIFGLVLWTGKGGDAVKVSTATGKRLAMGGA